MAANMKAVKLHMKSIQSTMQITKAMELLASSKLRRAKERADASRPYFHTLRDTLADIAAWQYGLFIGLYRSGKSGRWCYVVVAERQIWQAATMPTCLKRWKRRWQERTVLCFPSEKRR